MLVKRFFQSSSQALYPRMPFAPKRAPPVSTPKTATSQQLEAPIAAGKVYPFFPPKKQVSALERRNGPKPQKRTITDVETGLPLPTTFAPGESFATFKTRSNSEPLPQGEYHFPWKLYEITLRRGLTGLPSKIREVVTTLGLKRRHQVVWRQISPRSAGQILKIKELVTVRLVNEIPPKPVRPTGYTKISNLML